MGKFTGILLALLLFGSTVETTKAAVIYDGGSGNLIGTYYADAPYTFGTAVAAPFTLQLGASTITDVHWWGGCYFGPTCPAGDFTLSFYADSSGVPGTLIGSAYSVGNANQTATGNTMPTYDGLGDTFDEYSYSADLGPLVLSPSTPYWLVVSDNTGTAPVTWGMETTSDANVPGTDYQYCADANCEGPGWNPIPALAFNLTNDRLSIPEPATLALLGAGLAGICLMRRRKAA